MADDSQKIRSKAQEGARKADQMSRDTSRILSDLQAFGSSFRSEQKYARAYSTLEYAVKDAERAFSKIKDALRDIERA